MYMGNGKQENDKLIAFLNTYLGKQIDSGSLRKTFEMSTLEYSAAKILEAILNARRAQIKE